MKKKRTHYESPKVDVFEVQFTDFLCDSDTGGENPDPGGWN